MASPIFCHRIGIFTGSWRAEIAGQSLEHGESGEFSRCHDTDPGVGHPDIFVVPGRLTGPAEIEEAEPYARWLLDRHAQGATLAASCGGSFMIAATGLLAARPATTHWLFAERFRERFPDVRLEIDKIVIEDGDIITAGGLMAWTDLGLRIVDRLLGPSVMIETGKFLLIDPSGREQRHYSSFAPRLTHGDEPILKVQHWLQARAGRATSVTDMAGHAGLEERTFLRRFKAATGMKPIEYVQHLRVGKARSCWNSPAVRSIRSPGRLVMRMLPPFAACFTAFSGFRRVNIEAAFPATQPWRPPEPPCGCADADAGPCNVAGVC